MYAAFLRDGADYADGRAEARLGTRVVVEVSAADDVSREDSSYDDRNRLPRRARPGARVMSENIVPIGDWGKSLLEERLFRAAERVGADTSGADSAEVS